MRQLILLVLVFFASQWLFKKLRRAQAGTQARGGPQPQQDSPGMGRRPGARRAPPGTPQLPDQLVRCAQCGVHMPRGEAIVAEGHRFCSSDHARRYAARPTGRDAR
jgi:uncharacterized protein